MGDKFDACPHQIRLILIQCGKLLWPGENNITVLHDRMCQALGIEPIRAISTEINHLPTPIESAMADPMSKLSIECPQCGQKTFVLNGLCGSCKDSEGGKYKTMFECYRCHHKEKSEERLVVWLERLGVDFGTQTKESLGVKTITDKGIK